MFWNTTKRAFFGRIQAVNLPTWCLQNPETDIKFNVGFTVKPTGFSRDPETQTLKTKKTAQAEKSVPMKKNLLTSLGTAAIAFFISQSSQQQSLFLY